MDTLRMLPIFLAIYLYFIPRTLIHLYADKYIEQTFGEYGSEYSDIEFIKSSIINLVSFVSFLCTYGGIGIAILCDSEFQWGKISKTVGILFVVSFIFLLMKYITQSLKLTNWQTGFEWVCLIGTAIFYLLTSCI